MSDTTSTNVQLPTDVLDEISENEHLDESTLVPNQEQAEFSEEEKKEMKRVYNKKRSTTKGENSQLLGVYSVGGEIPRFQTDESACFDIQVYFEQGQEVQYINQGGVQTRKPDSSNKIRINPEERMLVPTGLFFDIPKGYCLEVYPRSGLSFKDGITLNNCTGIIDSDYVDELFVSIKNSSYLSKYIEVGERIAQAKLVKLVETEFETLKEKPKQKTNRNGGFGSTGK